MLHPLVVEVGDVEVPARPYRDPARCVELAGAVARAADGALGRAVEGEHLDAVVEVLRDIQFTVGDGEVHGAAELARFLAGLSELALEAALAVEDLDAAVARVGDEHLAAGDGDAGRVVELPGPASLAAPRPHELVGRLLGRGHEYEVPHDGEHHRECHDPAEDNAQDLEHAPQSHRDLSRKGGMQRSETRPLVPVVFSRKSLMKGHVRS